MARYADQMARLTTMTKACSVVVAFIFTQTLPVQGAFTIQVVDSETKRGVPLVELATTAGQRWITDSQGVIAIDSPALLGRDKVFFHVRSPGYAFPKDGFGFRGKALLVRDGKRATLEIRRTQIAERLYRITGAEIYGHSVKAGLDLPIKQPLIKASVTGCDSVLSILYKDRIHWFWGDTNRLQYALGNFHTTGATSPRPGAAAFIGPDKGVHLDYFEDDRGFVRPMAEMPGEGPTWISALAVLKDREGRERLVGSYEKVKGFLTIYERGLMVWDDENEQFKKLFAFDTDTLAFPHGHGFVHRPGGSDTEMRYFGYGYPFFRVPNTFEAWSDPAAYEVFTLLDEESRRFGWKKSEGRTPVWTIAEQRKRIGEADGGWIQMVEASSGKEVVVHRASVSWNTYRNKWIMIATEQGGATSFLGELWYAEADQPEGPWMKGVKIVTHDQYSFYNPRHHPFFDQGGGRVIYFEATYTRLFSKTPEQHRTPLYDYNQIMCRLDLSDPRLKAAQN